MDEYQKVAGSLSHARASRLSPSCPSPSGSYDVTALIARATGAGPTEVVVEATGFVVVVGLGRGLPSLEPPKIGGRLNQAMTKATMTRAARMAMACRDWSRCGVCAVGGRKGAGESFVGSPGVLSVAATLSTTRRVASTGREDFNPGGMASLDPRAGGVEPERDGVGSGPPGDPAGPGGNAPAEPSSHTDPGWPAFRS